MYTQMYSISAKISFDMQLVPNCFLDFQKVFLAFSAETSASTRKIWFSNYLTISKKKKKKL